MVLGVENPKESTKKWGQGVRTKRFNKAAGNKINTEKSAVLQHTNGERGIRNEKKKKKRNEKSSVYNSIKKNKIRRNKLIKEIRMLYTENYKMGR